MREQVHVRSRPFTCGRCNNTFARKDTLQRYVLSLPRPIPDRADPRQTPRRRLSHATGSEEADPQAVALTRQSAHQAGAHAPHARVAGGTIAGSNATTAAVVRTEGGFVDRVWEGIVFQNLHASTHCRAAREGGGQERRFTGGGLHSRRTNIPSRSVADTPARGRSKMLKGGPGAHETDGILAAYNWARAPTSQVT